MRTADIPLNIDWLAISFRWLALLGLSISLAYQMSFPLALVVLFLVAALWNTLLTILAQFNWRLPAHRFLNVASDLLIANFLYYFIGPLQSPPIWLGLLPIISAGLFYETRSLLLVVLLSIITLGGQAFIFLPPLAALIYALAAGIFFLLIGLLVNFLSGRVLAKGQQEFRKQLKTRREAERIERERRQVLYNLISTLSATLNYQRVLDTALDLSATALANATETDQKLVSAVLLFSSRESNEARLQVGSSRRFTPADVRVSLTGTKGLIGRVIDEGEPQVLKQIAKDPELACIVSLRACQSVYCLPLRSGLEAYGVLLFAHPEVDFFTSERREILEIIANQAMIALQNARLYRDLELEKERMMEIQEEARKKLARDLHDGPTQSVAALAMRVNFARRLIERDSKSAADELYKIEELARRTTKEIRHMLFTLRPLVLESQGLVAALESMADKMHETFDQNVSVEVDADLISMLEMSKKAVIFYLAEEAVNNARKHAQAEHVWVRIKAMDAEIAQLEIEDDGNGFDSHNVETTYDSRGSLGMVNMRERAELVNGILTIDSVSGRGTCVRVLIPLSEEASDRLRRSM